MAGCVLTTETRRCYQSNGCSWLLCTSASFWTFLSFTAGKKNSVYFQCHILSDTDSEAGQDAGPLGNSSMNRRIIISIHSNRRDLDFIKMIGLFEAACLILFSFTEGECGRYFKISSAYLKPVIPTVFTD